MCILIKGDMVQSDFSVAQINTRLSKEKEGIMVALLLVFDSISCRDW